MATKNKETRESTLEKEMGDKRLPPQFRNFRNSRNFQIPPNFREFRDFGTFPPRGGGVLKDAGRRGLGCGGSRLAPGRARLWGVNCARASDFGRRELAPRIPKAPPSRLFRNFRNSRNFQISPSFRGFRDFGSFPPKRAAASGIPGFGGSDVGVEDWREAGLDLRG